MSAWVINGKDVGLFYRVVFDDLLATRLFRLDNSGEQLVLAIEWWVGKWDGRWVNVELSFTVLRMEPFKYRQNSPP
jgi:hypothetical protein